MIKKEKWISVFGGMLLINLIKLVSAAYNPSYYVETGLDFIKDNYGPFFAALLGTSAFDEFLFAKILVLFLIFAVVFSVLKEIDLFSNNRPVIFIITLIVSILSVRFMKENDFFTAILLPYGALGAAIVVFLPLLIYFYFVETSIPGSMLRRTAWVIYGLFLIIFMFMRQGEVNQAVGWIYRVALILILLAFIFDSYIHNYFGKIPWKKSLDSLEDQARMKRFNRAKDLINFESEGGKLSKTGKRELNQLKKEFKSMLSRT